MLKVKPGEWCFGVRCKHCGTPIPLFEDKDAGATPVEFAGEGRLQATCPKCHREARYGTKQVERFQAHAVH